MEITKIDLTAICKSLQQKSPEEARRELESLQLVVYTMVGGGMLGRSAVESPAGFYIDTRVSKRPYPTKAIYQAVKVLGLYAEVCGLSPYALPKMPEFHPCGIF